MPYARRHIFHFRLSSLSSYFTYAAARLWHETIRLFIRLLLIWFSFHKILLFAFHVSDVMMPLLFSLRYAGVHYITYIFSSAYRLYCHATLMLPPHLYFHAIKSAFYIFFFTCRFICFHTSFTLRFHYTLRLPLYNIHFEILFWLLPPPPLSLIRHVERVFIIYLSLSLHRMYLH